MRRVFRDVNDYPGVLEFSVEPDKKPNKISLNGYNKDYLLISEFKPKNKDMFIKDYFNLFNREGERNEDQFSYQWIKHNKNLKVSVVSPTFREQLLIDYPNLKKVVVKYFVYIFSDPDFIERMKLCGIEALEEIPHSSIHRPMTLKFPQDFNTKKATAFVFSEKQLNTLKSKRDISIFTYMSVSFFENELEEFEVGLELKFTNIPYFQFLIRNQYANSTFSILKVIGVIAILMIVLCLLLLICSRKNNIDIRDMVDSTANSRQGYATGNDSFNEGRNKIQMSNLKV